MGKKKDSEETTKTSEAVEALLSLADTNDSEAQDFETAGVVSQTNLTSTNLYDMQSKLDEQQRLIDDLTLRLTQRVLPFSEESLTL